MKLSVIIPVYNEEMTIEELLERVMQVDLGESIEVEIIIANDGSTDGSAEVIKKFPAVQYLLQTNAGISATRNRGIEHAQGDFLAFLDADDKWVENKIVLQMAAFDNDPKLDIVFGHVQQFFSPELADLKNDQSAELELMPGYIPSTLLIKRDAFLQVGLFETNWKMGEFASWYLRSLEQGLQQLMLPDLVALRRLHDSNNGLQQRSSINNYIHIIKASLDRRRSAINREETRDIK